MKLLTGLGLLAMTAGLVGCGGSEPSTDNAVANETSAMPEQADIFAPAESKMNAAMMAAVGTDVGDSWAKKMLAHHQGAIDMSEIILQQNPPADVAEMARSGIEKQRKDMAAIQKLLKEGAPNQQSAELYRQAMMDMQQKMQSAKGADASETFMRKMLEHHKGAVAMSDVALQNGVSGALREQVEKTRSENAKDAAMTEAMLRGESMQQAMAGADARSAEAKAGPAAADTAGQAGKAGPVRGASSKDKAAHDMNSMGDMDMNNM